MTWVLGSVSLSYSIIPLQNACTSLYSLVLFKLHIFDRICATNSWFFFHVVQRLFSFSNICLLCISWQKICTKAVQFACWILTPKVGFLFYSSSSFYKVSSSLIERKNTLEATKAFLSNGIQSGYKKNHGKKKYYTIAKKRLGIFLDILVGWERDL